MKYLATSLRSALRSSLVLPLACLASLAFADVPPKAPDIVSAAVADGRFEVLAAALEQAGLVDTLRGAGPFTVFAPTDEAFAALPEGAVADLLRPANRARLQRILKAHVVSGRVTSADLLPAGRVDTLAGAGFALGLRVGPATVTQTDVECSNGILHVIDAVLLPPPAEKHEESTPMEAAAVIHAALDQGVPMFNAGNPQGCADVYRAAAETLVAGGRHAASDLARWDLRRALKAPSKDPAEHAWALRHAFDRTLADLAFEPTMEASLPQGFPKPGPVGRVVEKKYPRYRAARADGGRQSGTFWTLFKHIKKNKVEMTAPVEMTMDADMRMADMAFLYESPSQGSAGAQGRVAVLDLDRVTVLSIGMRGRRDDDSLRIARKLIEERMQALSLHAVGSWRVLGYNSPMVAASKQYWELQVPIAGR